MVIRTIPRYQQWMCTVKVGKFIQEYAAVYLTAGLFAYVIIELMAPGEGTSVSLTHKIHQLEKAFAF